MQKHVRAVFECGLIPDIQVGNIQDSGWYKNAASHCCYEYSNVFPKSHQYLAALIMPQAFKMRWTPVQYKDAAFLTLKQRRNLVVEDYELTVHQF